MNILFLCTGNSCRSQMAEGWAREIAGDKIEVLSDGIVAHGKNPRTIAIMKEAGIDISAQESTQLTNEMLNTADILVTVCDHADEHCPAIPAGKRKVHLSLTDPAKATGNEVEIISVFRASRDEIHRLVTDFIEELELVKPSIRGRAIIPMLLKINMAALKNAGQYWRGYWCYVVRNLGIKPFSMALLAWIFIGVLFRPWLPIEQIDSCIAGLIILSAAPCTAMVFV